MSHWPTPYTDLNAVLHELVGRVKNDLSDNFIGAYLQGSFAIGDFDTHSDVDLIVITAADISDSQLSALQEVHGDIFDLSSPWAQHLEGSYIPKGALRQFPPPPRLFYYLDNGQQELIRSDHDDSLVVYWVLREKGITLAGPEPRSLIAPISVDALRREVRDTMQVWGKSLLAQSEKLDNRWRQSFVVVSYCRMLQTLETGTIESKLAAVAWAKTNLDHQWHPLVESARKDRPDPSSKVRQRANPDVLRKTREFLTYAMERTR
jgi:hypothetical protein